MSVKDRILLKRKELGINQTELAKRAGLKPPAISQYESGQRQPSYDALIKLANALDVKVDYLVSGVEFKDTQILDPKNAVLAKVMQNLELEKQTEVLNYAFSVSGQTKMLDIWSTDPKQYARYVFEYYFNRRLPVDVQKLVKEFNVNIIKGDLNGTAEAILLKSSKTIIIDLKQEHKERIKFTIATLLGNLFIPWHTASVYYIRKSGNSSLQTENVEEMEASTFATHLISPPEELEKDLSIYKTANASLPVLKKLAAEKYEVSLNSICNRLVEMYKDRFAIIVTSNFKIKKQFASNIIIKDIDSEINGNSKAFDLIQKPSLVEEFKEGKVPASAWIENAKENEFVYESSVYNPVYKSVFSIITRLKK